MSFLAPLFALGLAALAIPILVHLVHKERKETTLFPSLMFLLRTPYQHSRRQRIRDWLLFLTRMMVFLLLVAAFARPVFDRPPDAAAAAAGGGREVVILLDRSFSMQVGDRWTRAQAAARQALDGLTAADRGTLILFADQPRLVREDGDGRQALRAAIDSASPGDAATRYAPALILARRTLAESSLPKKEVIVISDYQRSGWDVQEEARLASGTTITPVDVATGDVADRAVRAVELRRSVADGRERITVLARPGEIRVELTARGDAAQRGPELERMTARLRELLGAAVFTDRADEELEATVGSLLRAAGATVATAESCTGGLLASRLTEVAGSSDYFLGAVVAYSDEVKVGLLGVTREDLAAHGAVSEPVARALAAGARRVLRTDYGIGITGIAGPTGGSPEKPLGTVHLALAGPAEVAHRAVRFPGDRQRVRWQATQLALEMLRRELVRGRAA